MPTTMLTTSKMLIVVTKHKCCLHFYKKKSNTVLLPSQIMLQQEPLSKQFVRYRGLQAGLWGVINYFYHCHIFSYGPFLFLSILNINLNKHCHMDLFFKSILNINTIAIWTFCLKTFPWETE